MKSFLVTIVALAACAAALLYGMSTASAQYSIQYSYGNQMQPYPVQPIIVQTPQLPIQLPVEPPDCITLEQVLAVLQMLQDRESEERGINRDLIRDVLDRLEEERGGNGGNGGGLMIIQPVSPYRCLQPIRNIGRAIALANGWTPPARFQMAYGIPIR